MGDHTGTVRGGLGFEQPSRQHACHRHRCNVAHHSSNAGGDVVDTIRDGLFGLRAGRKGNLRGVGLRPKQRGRCVVAAEPERAARRKGERKVLQARS